MTVRDVRAHPGLHEAVLDFVRRRGRTGSVLDLGAGSGALAAELAAAGHSVTAYDLEPPAAAPAGVAFHAADLDAGLPSDVGGPYDVVLAIEVVEHLGAPGPLLSGLGSVVAPGGVAIVSTPNVSSPLSRYLFLRTGRFHQFGEPDLAYGHVMPLAEWQVRLFLGRGGLTVTDVVGVGDVFATYGAYDWRSRALTWALRPVRPLMRDALPAWARIYAAEHAS